MKKFLFSFIIPLVVFLLTSFVSPLSSSAQTSGSGGGSGAGSVACPVGYTCVPVTVNCPDGYTCTQSNRLPNCPDGYVCSLIGSEGTVSGGESTSGGSSVGTSTPCYVFSTNLQLGSRGADVVALQTFLIANGYAISDLTIIGVAQKGYFGISTMKALQSYQRANGIPYTGFFGPLTRESVGKACNPVVSYPQVVVSNTQSMLGSPMTDSRGVISSYPFTFKFTLTSNGNTVYISRTSSLVQSTANINTGVNYQYLIVDPSTLSGDGDQYYIIPRGTSRTFTLNGLATNAGSGVGFLQINQIYYGITASNLQSNSISQGLGNLKLDFPFNGGGPSTDSTVRVNNTRVVVGSPLTRSDGTVISYPVTFKFTLAAGSNSPIYLGKVPAHTNSVIFDAGNGNILPNIQSLVANNPSVTTGDTSDAYYVAPGTSREFGYDGQVINPGTSGLYTAQIVGLQYGLAAGNLNAYSVTSGLDNLKTSFTFNGGGSTQPSPDNPVCPANYICNPTTSGKPATEKGKAAYNYFQTLLYRVPDANIPDWNYFEYYSGTIDQMKQEMMSGIEYTTKQKILQIFRDCGQPDPTRDRTQISKWYYIAEYNGYNTDVVRNAIGCGATTQTSTTSVIPITPVIQPAPTQTAPICTSPQVWNGSTCATPREQTRVLEPTATFLVEGQHSYAYNVGQVNHYTWSSTNADRFYSSYTSTGGTVCGGGPWVANTASGQSSSYISSAYAGCTWTVTFTAINSQTGRSASDTVTVKVNPVTQNKTTEPTRVEDTSSVTSAVWNAVKEYMQTTESRQ